MKQRLASVTPTKTATAVTSSASWNVWQSPAGWTGLLGADEGVKRVLIGFPNRSALIDAIRSREPVPVFNPQRDDLCDRLDAYFAGTPDSFADVVVADLWRTPFQRAVISALRQVRCGETTSYAELASLAGRPGAARAVGQVMATNPVPIIVPCHRVLASSGKLGGFSAPTGLTLKQWLLDLEAPHAYPKKPR